MATGKLEWAKGTDTEKDGLALWSEVRIDTRTPSIARIYDCFLDGKDNFAVDRAVVEAILRVMPEARELGFDNRAWIGRAVRWLVGEAGIRQIIDLGSGLPTTSNVHDHAQRVAPETRVVYVDNDPIVLAHGRAILSVNDRTTVITADVRDPEGLFQHPELRELIDFEEPFAIMLASVLHHLPDEEDQRVAAEIRQRLTPGSYLAIANAHDPGDERVATMRQTAEENGMETGWFRPYPQHRMYFGDLDLVPPGLCPGNEWKPDAETPVDSPVHHLYLAGIGQRLPS